MAGGMRIDNHSFWGGAKGKASPFPDGPHKEKEFSSAEGAGEVNYYEDTTEAIKSSQLASVKKVKEHPMKHGFFH